MMAGRAPFSIGIVLLSIAVAAMGCSPNTEPQTGSQTNWLRACQSDAGCDGQSCICGICASECDADRACAALPGASCVNGADSGAIALCGGYQPPVPAICLSRCSSGECGQGQFCVAGVCSPLPQTSERIVVDESTRLQELTGIGATLAYAEQDVVQHPRSTALYETMFAQLGLDLLRLRNRHGYAGDEDLSTAAAIVAAASSSLGRQPAVILTSWSPPAALKANGATICRGDTDVCTLTRSPGGGFDYAGYADYWRAALEAYAVAGVVPSYISIQNNPDFVPSSSAPGEGCKFLPVEGGATVSVNGVASELEFPGFAQALDAVVTRMNGSATPPKVIAPDVSAPNSVAEYVRALDLERVDAIGHHLYGIAPDSEGLAQLRDLGQLGESTGRALFQTEMQADGFDTAILLHHTFVTEGATAYLHNALVGPAASLNADSGVLIAIDGDGIETQPAYDALRHYAFYTDPGWVRVSTESTNGDLLASAWLSPEGTRLTVVILNTGLETIDVELDFDETSAVDSRVIRTVFDGVERSADLGRLSTQRLLRLSSRSLVTVELDR